MIKNSKKYICYLLIVISICALSGCSNNNNDDELIAKLSSEMQYLDNMLLNMLNNVNGIAFENYKVTAEKIEENSEQESGSSSENSSNDSGSGESEDQQSESEVGSSDNKQSSNDSNNSKKNEYKYKLSTNSVLTQEKTPNWEELVLNIELIYSNWSIITLDLYKGNVNNQNILNFNTDLDTSIKAIQSQNKEQTLISLAKLYSYIPIYNVAFSNDQNQTNLYKVKSAVFNAYAIIGQNRNDEVKRQLQQAEEALIAIMNNVGSKNEKEYNINKSYILLKDLQNTIDENDVNIFYLKYKNLMQELCIL